MRKLLFLTFVLSVSFYSLHAQTAPADTTLKQYAGTYNFPEGSVVAQVIVNFDNGELSISSSAGTSSLEKKGVDSFAIIGFQGTAKFKRDANKKITGVTIDARGYLLEGTKEETTAIADFTDFYMIGMRIHPTSDHYRILCHLYKNSQSLQRNNIVSLI